MIEFSFFKKVPRSESFILGMDVEGNERQQLYYVDEHKEIERLTKQDDALYVFGGSSPDGKAIAYASNERNATIMICIRWTFRAKLLRECMKGMARIVF
ncbi:hypothetical protein JCM19055_4412 [Geomicrobium sp. JCM 19055]|nr:hypothetical protein JCM19055_4412 [Geomicrobium sp. JCM 19055]